jgi:hypothetical protein
VEFDKSRRGLLTLRSLFNFLAYFLHVLADAFHRVASGDEGGAEAEQEQTEYETLHVDLQMVGYGWVSVAAIQLYVHLHE